MDSVVSPGERGSLLLDNTLRNRRKSGRSRKGERGSGTKGKLRYTWRQRPLSAVSPSFQDGLRWPKSEVGGDEAAFFKTDGAISALFPSEALAADVGVDVVEDGALVSFSLAHNVAEEEGVDLLLTQAAEAGATVVKEAQGVFLGLHGYFADPEGFLWEVAWTPYFPMVTDGSIKLPD